MTGSREVSWWSVHQFVGAAVSQANCGPLPTAGTPAWHALADGDPRKLLAVAVAGEHWVLRVEIGQDQLAESARCIAESADWTAVRKRIAQGRGPYIPRRREIA